MRAVGQNYLRHANNMNETRKPCQKRQVFNTDLDISNFVEDLLLAIFMRELSNESAIVIKLAERSAQLVLQMGSTMPSVGRLGEIVASQANEFNSMN